MERASKEVKKRQRRGGKGGSCRFLCWIAFCCPLVPPPVAFAQAHDVLLVEKPGHLVVYNSFQQSLTVKQLSELRPFAPIKILKSKDLLSDGLTACMKVEIDGELHFLLRDESGKLAGLKMLGMVKSFSSKSFVADTIEILVSNFISLRNPSSGTRSPLVAGDRCVRYFVDGGAVYLKRLDAQPRYGWGIVPTEKVGLWWKRVIARSIRHGLPAAGYERIVGKIRQLNQSLSRLHVMFARETGKALPAPQWMLQQSGAGWHCSLQPMETMEEYRRTTSELTVLLQTYLIGTGYEAAHSDQGIEIRLR